MIKYKRTILQNGLKVLVYEDPSTPLAAVNIVYNVGARDESSDKTGFAHLFEHLMFGGTKNIPNYDGITQDIGADNNAFTNNDITNYYLSFPSANLETALWLEADRMRALDFSQRSLDVQKNVVIEEFKQRYLNQPYGDLWLKMRPLVYKVHPYQWATIGKEISHIEDAKLEDVEAFFYKYYCPANAVLTVSGNVKYDEVLPLIEKYFGTINSGESRAIKNLPIEPVQTEARKLIIEANVPVNVLYKIYHMADRLSPLYYRADLLSDLLSRGKSSIMHQELVKKKKLFSQINVNISGDIDPGMFVVSGKLNENIGHEEAEAALDEITEKTKSGLFADYELEKVKNQTEATLLFSDAGALNMAMNLSYFELLGDADLINKEIENYRAVTLEDVVTEANRIILPSNSSVLYYKANK